MRVPMKLWWGDIHGHTQLSTFCFWKQCIPSMPADYYTYARDVSKLDFSAITDHDTSISDADWELVKEATHHFNDAGRFVTIPAFEWTSWVYGHQNVYYETEAGTGVFRCSETGQGWDPEGDTPKDLWRKLRAQGVGFITVPHHVGVTQMPVDWDFYDAQVQPVVEITSLWGNFEFSGNESNGRISDVIPGHFVRDALKLGYRLGFVGGGDSHDGRPGAATFGGRVKPNILPHQPSYNKNPLGWEPAPVISDRYANWRGLTALYAPSLTRDEVFRALTERRTYATTGARIRVWFEVEQSMMGQNVTLTTPDQMPRLSWEVEGTHRLCKVTVVRNGRDILIRAFSNGETATREEWVDTGLSAAVNYYYLRVEQQDGHKAWTSPVFLEWAARPRLSHNRGPLAGDRGVYTINNEGPSTAQAVRVALYREPARSLRQTDTDWSQLGGSVRLRFERLGPTSARVELEFGDIHRGEEVFKGTLRISGMVSYRVRTVRFRLLKFGGDLYSDDLNGAIEWCVKGNTGLALDLEEDRDQDSFLDLQWEGKSAETATLDRFQHRIAMASLVWENRIVPPVILEQLQPQQHVELLLPVEAGTIEAHVDLVEREA